VAKTLDDLVGEIRLMLKDRREPYRYSQADVIEAVNSALREVKRLRPDAFLTCCVDGTDGGGTIAMPDYTPADLGLTPTPTAFPIDENFYLAVVFHVVGKLQLGDDEFAVDNRAMTLLAAFRQNLLGA
jgi:hypothetical protein